MGKFRVEEGTAAYLYLCKSRSRAASGRISNTCLFVDVLTGRAIADPDIRHRELFWSGRLEKTWFPGATPNPVRKTVAAGVIGRHVGTI